MSVLGTFSSGSVLTAAELNQFNNVTALAFSTNTFPSATSTPLEFTALYQVVADTSNWHDTSTNPSRITVDKNGIYLVGGAMQFAYNSTDAYFYTNISKNGVVALDNGQTTGYYPGNSLSGVIAASAGDYFELVAYQTSGTTVGQLAGRSSFYVILLRTT